MIQRCVECERRLPRSQFSCRIRAQFDTLPTAEEVDLQPRCMECTRLYAKRKRFEKKLKKFAASKGSWFRSRREAPRAYSCSTETLPSSSSKKCVSTSLGSTTICRTIAQTSLGMEYCFEFSL